MGSIKRGTFKEFYVMRRRITCCNIKVGHTQQSKEKSFQTLLRKTVVVGAAATRLSRSRPTFSDTKVHRLCQKHMKSLRCFARVFASTFLHTVESLLATPLSSFYVLLIPYTFFCKIVNDHFETLPKTHEHWRFILMVRWCHALKNSWIQWSKIKARESNYRHRITWNWKYMNS